MRRNTIWIMLLAMTAIVFSAHRSEALLTLNRVEGAFESTVVTSNTASVGNFGPGNLLYGFDVIALATPGLASIYDCATLLAATDTQGIFIDEGGSATSGDTWKSDWAAPYQLVTDLTVNVQSANVVIYHDRK